MKRAILLFSMIIITWAAFAQLTAVGKFTTVSHQADVSSIYLFSTIDL